MRHEKDVQSSSFQKILDGTKTFELRLANRTCNEGDTLVLYEQDEAGERTGRSIEKTITCISKTNEVHFWPQEDIEKYGYQILGFK